MRKATTLRLDLGVLEQARQQAGLPADTPAGAVVRYTLALMAGIDPTDHLDSVRGKGSITYRDRTAQAA